MQSILVRTESGHEYTLTPQHFIVAEDNRVTPIYKWTASEARSHDEDGTATGIVIYGPKLKLGMVMCWYHKERGMQLRITTKVKEIVIKDGSPGQAGQRR